MEHPKFERLDYEGGFDENDEYEAAARGYRSHVWVVLSDGRRKQLTFYDPVRLKQTLDDECRSGRLFFTEPGLIVVPHVSRQTMEDAARALANEGYWLPNDSPSAARASDDDD
jgi:hypothetical protein